MRSSSGPRQPPAVAGEVGRGAAARGARRIPHGHGFEAATSMKRVGKTITRWARTIVDAPVLERLAQRLQRRPRELRQLVEEQHAAVRERRLAGLRRRRRRRPGRPAEIVWCGARNGRRADEPAAPCRPAIDWMRVTSIASCAGQRRQQRRQPPREHRLAGAGRAVQEQVVAAGGGDLERRDERVVAAHVGEVGLVGPAGSPHGAPGPARGARVAPEHLDRLLQVSTPRTSSSPTSAASRARARGSSSRGEPGRARALRHRERAADRAHLAGQRQLAHDRAAGQRVGASWPLAAEDRDRERQVEARAHLAQVRRREVDRDPLAAGTRSRS